MQVNPNLQYSQEDAELTLDNSAVESASKLEPCDIKDETDLSEAEKDQKEVVVKGTQVISSPREMKQLRADDRLIVLGCMAAGVLSVILVYVLLVFL